MAAQPPTLVPEASMTSTTPYSPAADSRDPDADLLGDVLTVSRVVAETTDAMTIAFSVPDKPSDTYSFRPGQFLTIAVPSERTGWVARCYSISSSPSQSDLAITVKRT